MDSSARQGGRGHSLLSGRAAAPEGRAARSGLDDTMLERHWMLVATFSFRSLSLLSGVVPLVSAIGLRAALAPALVAVAVAVGCAVIALRAKPSPGTSRRLLLAALAGDVVLAVGLNLWASLVIPLPPTETGFGLFWPLMQGSVVLALAFAGLWAAVALVGLGLAVNLVMVSVASQAGTSGLLTVLGYFGWLLLAMLAAQVVRALARSHAALARSHGRRAGEEAERVRGLRRLHDTALQSLKSIALLSSAGGIDEAERLRTIGEIARAESAMLRRMLDESAPPTLAAELASLVDFSTAVGTPTELVISGELPASLPSDLHEACAGAVLEALTNARHHADARLVLVEVARDEATLRVDVSDDGCGFVPALATRSFGLKQSIVGRVSDVGGVATIRSSPGNGTTVSLLFPLVSAQTQARLLAQPPSVTTPHSGSGLARRRRLAVGRPA